MSPAFARVAIAASLAIAASACREKHDEAPAPPAALETPAPPPDRLIAEATIAAPDATWQRVQRGVGGAAGILPSTLGGIVCSVAGIDIGLADAIDGSSAAYGVVAGDLATPAWAFAMRLGDARRARALVEGESSRFDVHEVAGFEVLASKGARGEERAVGAIAHGAGAAWLVLARTEADLLSLAPYATRTLPTRGRHDGEAIAIDVPGSALAGPLRSEIEREWTDTRAQMLASDRELRAKHGGRAPDFGDPTAIVALLESSMQSRLAILSDLRSAHVAIDPGDDDVRAVFTAAPVSQDGAAARAIAAIHPGDSALLRATTRDAALALLVRDAATPDGRAKDAADLEAAIDGALGGRLSGDGAKKVHAAIDDWAAARGDAWTLAFAMGDGGRGLVLDALAADPTRASRAVHEAALAMARVPALREPLATWLHVRDVTFGGAEIPGGGHASTATFALPPPAPAYTLAWSAGANDVKVALAESPLALLAPPLPARTLGDDPTMRALLDALGEVSGAIVLQPSRAPGCDRAGGGVVVGWGRRDVNGAASMWGEAVASDSALRCLAKSSF